MSAAAPDSDSTRALQARDASRFDSGWFALVAAALALSCFAFVAPLIAGNLEVLLAGGSAHFDGHSVGLSARYTARAALPVFLLVYVSGPLARLYPSARGSWLAQHQRGLGLTFAGAHGIHLIALVWATRLNDAWPAPGRLVPGGLAYLFILMMVLTSNQRAQQVLGLKRWRTLHRLGIHYIWLLFAVAYALRLRDPERALPAVVGLSACLSALGLRLCAFVKQRQRLVARVSS